MCNVDFSISCRFEMAYSGGGISADEEKALSSASADVLNEKIAAVGDFIREFKKSKPPKDQINAEVDVLKKLKGFYKAQTGQEWSPNATSAKKEKTPTPPKVEIYSGGGLSEEETKYLQTAAAEALDIKIKSCGDLIRKLKSEKAPKEEVGNEVQVLLKLKELYKNKTGQDWKPSEQPKQESKKKAQQPPAPKGDTDEKSEKQLKREAKKAEKQAKKAQHKAANETNEGTKQNEENEGEDVSVGKYGNQKMNQSHTKPDFRLIENFSILTEKLDGQLVWVRARLHTSRAKGKDT